MTDYSITLTDDQVAAVQAQADLLNANAAAAQQTAQADIDAQNAADPTPNLPAAPAALVLTVDQVIQQDVGWQAGIYAQQAQARVVAQFAALPTDQQATLVASAVNTKPLPPTPMPPVQLGA